MAFNPYSITKEHVLQAVARIKADGIELIPSIRWEVVIDNERYPPLEVLRYSHQEMNGELLWEHSGGANTNNYLKKLGFDMVEKNTHSDPIMMLVQKYKVAIQENKLADEVFKWKLVKQFKGKPNLEAPDFYEEIKCIDHSNLMYMNGARVIKHLAKDRPEQYRACFKLLFNEDLPLADRLKRFPAEVLRIYRELQPDTTQSTHHDERTIATLLTYHNPDKYTFYMDSFYQKYCTLVGIQPKKAGEKYIHYLDLLDNFIAEYLEPDKELLDKVRELLPENAYPDRNHKLLAQDIFYSMLDDKTSNDLQFQKNEKELKDILQKSSPGNVNIFFKTLDNLIEELSIPDALNLVFSTSNKLSFQVGKRFCLNLERDQFYFIAPKNYMIEGVEKTSFDGKGHPSWYHKASASIVTEHYAAIKEAVQVELESKKNTDAKKYDNAAFRKAAFDKYYRVTLFDFQENKAMISEIKKDSSGRTKMPLNTILYGPPGTGKTYKLRNEYFKLFTDDQSTQTLEEYCLELVKDLAWWEVISVIVLDLKSSSVKQIFDHPLLEAKNSISVNKTPKNTIWSLLQWHTKDECPYVKFEKRKSPQFFWKDEKGDWTIDEGIVKAETPEFYNVLENYRIYKPIHKTEKRYVFTTFHQSYSYEDFIEGIKPKLTESKEESESTDVQYHIEKGIFKEIVDKAIANSEKSFAIFIDEINRGNIANIFGELITLIEEDKRLGKDEEMEVTLPYSKEKFGVPANLYIIGTMNTADRSVEALDTALRRRFSFIEMPPIYDLTKLQEEIKGYKLTNILQKINRRIEKLLGKDNLIGHSYFLGVTDDEGLRIAFQNKIIPLLQEYFYGDYGKIGLVLGEGFVTTSEEDGSDVFAAFGNYDSSGLAEKEVYHLAELVGEKRLTDAEFKAALDALMK